MSVDPECYHYGLKGQDTFPNISAPPPHRFLWKHLSLGSGLELSREWNTLKHTPFVSPRYKQRLWHSSTAGQSRNGLANSPKLSPKSPNCKGFNWYLCVALLLTFISQECGCQHQFGVDCGKNRSPLYTLQSVWKDCFYWNRISAPASPYTQTHMYRV